MYIAIWCTYRALLFDIVSTIVEALVIALHQFLYPFTAEWYRLWCKASGNGFFDLRHNFVKKWPWNLRKMQGKWCNGESSVLSNVHFNCTHQIFVHHRRLATPWIIMHIYTSFINQSHPFPYHWTTHGMFSIRITKLMMSFSRCHVLRIQETDYRPHFTCSGILYFLKCYKQTGQCVNTVRMSANSVHALPQYQQTQHARTIVTAALQRQYSQTELIFWITLVYYYALLF